MPLLAERYPSSLDGWKALKDLIMTLAPEIHKTASVFAIDFGDEGILTVKLTDVRKLLPDGGAAKEMANAGQIPWRPQEYRQLSVKRA